MGAGNHGEERKRSLRSNSSRYQLPLAPFCSLPVSQSLFALRKKLWENPVEEAGSVAFELFNQTETYGYTSVVSLSNSLRQFKDKRIFLMKK